MKKKICFVTTIADTVYAFLLDQIKFLHENGYEITVICNDDEEFALEHPTYITYIPVKMKRGVDIGAFRCIFQLYFIFKREKFHIVQYSTPNAAFYSAIAAKMAKVPVRLYAQWGFRYISFTGLNRKLFKMIEKLTCRFSTIIEPVSNSNLLFAQKERLFDVKKARVIWNGSANGINFSKFDYSKREFWRKSIRLKHDLSSHDFVIGFVGRLTKDKGVDELLKSFKQLCIKHDDIKLLVIGSEDNIGSLDRKLFHWAKTYPSIIFIDDTDEIEQYYSAMDLFVLPSYREGMASVVIEAQAMGTPVIVTNIPGLFDAMKEGVTGFIVQKCNVHDLIKTMEKCVENKDLLIKMGKNAHEFAYNHFDQAKLLNYILEDKNELYHTYVEKEFFYG